MTPRGTFRRIAQDLREQVREGALEPGAILPSESALAENHGVSRGTVRAALAQLTEDGLIEVLPGIGRRVVGATGGRTQTAVYQRIATDLAERLRAGEFGRDDPLPSESALVSEYGVARSTVRRAYRLLVDDGLVVVRHGAGAFPTPN